MRDTDLIKDKTKRSMRRKLRLLSVSLLKKISCISSHFYCITINDIELIIFRRINTSGFDMKAISISGGQWVGQVFSLNA